MTKRQRVGLIGCGKIGTAPSSRLKGRVADSMLPVTHAEAIQSIPELQLVALCDTNRDNLHTAGERYHIDRLYTNYRDLLLNEELDIISIATRTNLRAEIIETVAEHNVKGIYAEKPLSTNLADSRRALDAVAKRNSILVYGTQRRFSRLYERVVEILLSGILGEIRHILIEQTEYDLLMWSLPHSVDLLLFLSRGREAVSIQSRCTITSENFQGNVVDEDPQVIWASIEFENGVFGSILPGSGLTRILCNNGTITVLEREDAIVVDTVRDQSGKFRPSSQHEIVRTDMSGTQRAFAHLANSIQTGQDVSITLQDIFQGQNILLGIAYSAAQNGCVIAPIDVPDNFTVTGRFNNLYA